MKNLRFDEPCLHAINSDAFPLSGDALVYLMQAVLERGYPFRFCARGWSMAPFIRDGDVITVAPLKHNQVKIGEVFAFIHPDTDRLVVHRAVKRHDTGYFFQGDGVSSCSDGVIPYENTLGKVILIERDGHRIWLGLGMGRFIIVLLTRTGLMRPIYRWVAACHKRFSNRIDV